MFFNWIREKVKNAFLAGLGDAIAELDSGTAETSGAVTCLRSRLRMPTLPGPVPDEDVLPIGNGKRRNRNTD
jgi:hypothetical protein